MAFMYACESFRKNLVSEDASVRYYVQKQVDILKLRKVLTTSKRLKMYDKSGGIYILKLQGQGHNMRVVIQQLKDPNVPDSIFYFLRDYISQSDYEPRWRTWIEPQLNVQGQYLKLFPLDPNELAAAKKEYSQQTQIVQKVHKTLTPELSEWLQDFGVDQDFAIYETRCWVEFAEKEMRGFESQFCNLLGYLYKNGNDQISLEEIPDPNRNIIVLHDQRIFIALEDTGQIRNKYSVYVLLGGGFIENQKGGFPGLDLIQNDHALSQVRGKKYDFEIISRASYRAYPASILNDPKRWIELEQGSPKSNLALSPEQVGLLKDYRFPKFINGQAGSGKSEMLYYLFAEICFRKQVVGFDGNPIFLTENEELLERALFDTTDKIRNNAAYSSFNASDDIQQYFMPFQKFILEHLVEDPELYPPDKWVNFTKFKALYESSKLPLATIRKLPAEVAWFVIYSFIKGYDADCEELTPEDFKKLPKKDQQVIDQDTYEQVFREVWLPFYKRKRSEGYWDRLDLVRWVLRNYDELPEEQKYTVILCDEAQDFTRIELQLLLKLSKYLDYDLSELQQIPLTFAGDPFQTVNPTGFSLEKLKRLFGHEIEASMQSTLPPDFTQELQYNYRSGAPIVNLANIIQYIRYRFLEMTDLRLPQQAMRVGDYDLPETFTFEEFDQGLQEKLKYAAYIFPCNDGEEEQTLQSSQWLAKKDLNVKSAAQAKGSEYQVVVLYGFGDEFVRQFGEKTLETLMSESNAFSALKPGDKFKLLFFFNKLYVAITRAQEKLYLVDSREGFDALWNLLQSDFLDDIKDADWQVIRPEQAFQKGNPGTVEQIDAATARKNAEADRETANLYADPVRMRQAAKWFKMLGTSFKKDVQLCEAKALEFEQNYREAAEIYSEVYEYRDASRCYFIAGNWEKLQEANNKLLNEQKFQIRNFVARIMLNTASSLDDLFTHRQAVANIFRDRELKFPVSWEKDFYRMLAAQVRDQAIPTFAAAKKEELAQILGAFPVNDPELLNVAAELYFSTGNYQDAIRYWDRTEHVSHPAYQQARFRTATDINKKLFYLSQYADAAELLKFYRAQEDQVLEDFSAEIVQKALLDQGATREAIAINARYELPWLPLLRKQVKGIDASAILFLNHLNEHLQGLAAGKRQRFLQIDALNHILEAIKNEKPAKKITQEGRDGLSRKFMEKFMEKFQEETRLWQILNSFSYLVGLSGHAPDTFSKDYFTLFSALVLHWMKHPAEVSTNDFRMVVCAIEKTRSVFRDIMPVYFHLLESRQLTAEVQPLVLERQRKILFKIIRREIPGEEKQLDDRTRKNVADEVDRRLRQSMGPQVPSMSYEALFKIPEFPELPVFASEQSVKPEQAAPAPHEPEPQPEQEPAQPMVADGGEQQGSGHTEPPEEEGEPIQDDPDRTPDVPDPAPTEYEPELEPEEEAPEPDSGPSVPELDGAGEKEPAVPEKLAVTDGSYQKLMYELRIARMEIEFLKKQLADKEEIIRLLKKN
jgi:hypothetical protein